MMLFVLFNILGTLLLPILQKYNFRIVPKKFVSLGIDVQVSSSEIIFANAGSPRSDMYPTESPESANAHPNAHRNLESVAVESSYLLSNPTASP